MRTKASRATGTRTLLVGTSLSRWEEARWRGVFPLKKGVALPTPLDQSPDAVRAALAPLRHDFSVAVYAAGNPFAVGAIIRVAHNFLAREVLLVGDAPF